MGDVVVPINYMAVIAAAVSSMVIGYVWYGPLFGKVWMKEIKTTKSSMKSDSATMGKLYGMMFVGSLVMSFVLAHSIVFASAYLHVSGMSAALNGALWNWVGFIAPVTLGSVLWEGKTWKLWLINNGYYVVTLAVMGMILTMWV